MKALKNKWVKKIEGLTEEQKKEFIIKDNLSFGSWDFDILANEWNLEELEDWGLDINFGQIEEEDFSDKNKEINTDDLEKGLDSECPQCGFKFQK